MVGRSENEKNENDPVTERRREREERIQGSQAAAREKRKVSAIQKDRERLEKLRYKLNCVYFFRAKIIFFLGSGSKFSFLNDNGSGSVDINVPKRFSTLYPFSKKM